MEYTKWDLTQISDHCTDRLIIKLLRERERETREVVGSPSLEIVKTCPDKPPGNLPKVSPAMSKGGTRRLPEVPPRISFSILVSFCSVITLAFVLPPYPQLRLKSGAIDKVKSWEAWASKEGSAKKAIDTLRQITWRFLPWDIQKVSRWVAET